MEVVSQAHRSMGAVEDREVRFVSPENQLQITAVLGPRVLLIPPITYDGGIGGGGRVSFAYSSNLTEGNVDVGSGAQQGTIGYNTTHHKFCPECDHCLLKY